MPRKPAGPPTKLTEEMKARLEHIYQLDPTVREVAFYCDVTQQTLYNWKEKEPALFERLERLRERPVVAAKQAVISAFPRNPNLAMDYLARKRKDEFSNRSELTGPNGGPVQVEKVAFSLTPEDK